MSMKILFNDGWEFVKRGLDTPAEAMDDPGIPWYPVEIPHDWLIYDTRNLYEDGEGWYRKTFSAVPDADRTVIRFEGVYMDSTVFVNGEEAGAWKYGYTTFEVDVTRFLRPGVNEIKVRVVHRAPNSRWYSGAGIYRNVWLKTMPARGIASDGVYISTEKAPDGWYAIVDTETAGKTPYEPVSGAPGYSVRHTVFDPDGKIAAAADRALESTGTVGQKILVPSPAVWDIANPALYTLKTELLYYGSTVDEEVQRFGFRTVAFDPDRGFLLNGRSVKLRGVCQHHDLGCLGAAVNRSAVRRQLDVLRGMGVNAIRTAHNMPAVELMELADETGMLILSEAFDMWERPKTPYDYARFFPEWAERDVACWVRRDRNHPSVIMWSVGNEISDTHVSERGRELTRMLMGLVHRHDPRGNAPVTIGSNYMPWENARNCADVVKLAGYNYAEKYYERHHREHPDWIIYGSETSSIVQSRGIYHFPASQPVLADDDGQCSSLGNSATSWGAKSIEACITDDRDAKFSPGQFLWSGFDYIGEPTPYHTKNSYFGQIDTCGFPKDSYFVYRAEWTDYRTGPMVHVFPYWDFNEGQLIDVCACSNAPLIELFLDGESQGTFAIDHEKGKSLIGRWRIPYRKGTLRAVAYDENGNIVAEDVRRSFGDAVKLVVKPDATVFAADGRSLVFVEISAVDRDGNPVENANNRIEVEVNGAGRLVGLDNGDSTDYDQYKGTSMKLFSGKLLAVIAAGLESGEAVVEATSIGLEPAGCRLTALPCPRPEGITAFARNAKSERTAEIPVRKITLTSEDGTVLNGELKSVRVRAELSPPDATYRDVEWRVTNDAGIDTNIASVRAEGMEAVVAAVGDGKFRLRCMSRNGADGIRLISSLEFEATGLGPAYLNPYEFVSGGLWNASNCELGNGNDRGVATPRDCESHVGFRGLDFGEHGSDELTIPLFVLDGDEFPFQIWEGMPGEEGSEMLADVTYRKPSIWNTYQEETYRLPRRLKGVTTLCFVARRKAHIKGFRFRKPEKAFERLSAADCTRIYGDSFRLTADAVEEIGNNVTLEFDGMDFGSGGCSGIEICGRSHTERNTIHIRWNGTDGETVQIAEFPYSDAYAVKEFRLEPVRGLRNVSFVFLPGSRFDFGWFRFRPTRPLPDTPSARGRRPGGLHPSPKE